MYDISMLSKDQVLELLNMSVAADGHVFTNANVEFGTPVAATGVDPVRNTELIITGIPNNGFKNQATIFYDRIDLAEFGTIPNIVPVIQIVGEVTLEKIIDYFNTLYGSNLQADDIRGDEPLPTNIEGGVSFFLRAAAGSYAYRGNIELTIQPADIDLDVAITEKYLNGLVLNQPVV
jgi:hypothetical protein